jgi:hypothetical protein
LTGFSGLQMLCGIFELKISGNILLLQELNWATFFQKIKLCQMLWSCLISFCS